MYTCTLMPQNNTPSNTHVSLYAVGRVHHPGTISLWMWITCEWLIKMAEINTLKGQQNPYDGM